MKKLKVLLLGVFCVSFMIAATTMVKASPGEAKAKTEFVKKTATIKVVKFIGAHLVLEVPAVLQVNELYATGYKAPRVPAVSMITLLTGFRPDIANPPNKNAYSNGSPYPIRI